MSGGRKLRVLQVVDTLGVGGAETWLMDGLRWWAKNGAGCMDFLLTSGNRGVYDDEAVALGASLHYLRFARSTFRTFAREYRRILAAGRYDAIHDHEDIAGGWHLLVGMGGLPSVRVVHIHNPTIHMNVNYAVSPSRKFAATAGRKLVESLATDICGTSEEILRSYGYELRTTGRPRVSVLHCGIDVDLFNAERPDDRTSVLNEFGWPADTKLVLFVGRLDRRLEYPHPQNHKNSWFALNVIRLALEKDQSVRFIMAGDAAHLVDELERRIGAWGRSSEIRIAGIRQDVPRLMHAADVLLFPSVQEGLGMVAVEAQAAGLPVLASTAVPREAIVIPEIFDALSLDQTLEMWAQALLSRIAKPRPDRRSCRNALDRSAFAIANSMQSLERLYRGGER